MNLFIFKHRTDGKYLIRLEHPYDAGEDAEFSIPAVVSFNQVYFPAFYDYDTDLSLLFLIFAVLFQWALYRIYRTNNAWWK